MRIDPHRSFGKRECPSCGVEVEANYNYCPICGYEFPHQPRSRRVVLWLTAVVLLMALLSLWL